MDREVEDTAGIYFDDLLARTGGLSESASEAWRWPFPSNQSAPFL